MASKWAKWLLKGFKKERSLSKGEEHSLQHNTETHSFKRHKKGFINLYKAHQADTQRISISNGH